MSEIRVDFEELAELNRHVKSRCNGMKNQLARLRRSFVDVVSSEDLSGGVKEAINSEMENHHIPVTQMFEAACDEAELGGVQLVNALRAHLDENASAGVVTQSALSEAMQRFQNNDEERVIRNAEFNRVYDDIADLISLPRANQSGYENTYAGLVNHVNQLSAGLESFDFEMPDLEGVLSTLRQEIALLEGVGHQAFTDPERVSVMADNSFRASVGEISGIARGQFTGVLSPFGFRMGFINNFSRGMLGGIDFGERIRNAVRAMAELLVEQALDNFDGLGMTPEQIQEVMRLGLTPEHIQFAIDLDYTPADIIDLFNSFNEADIAFFSYLLSGTEESFIAAFTVNPWSLSDEMTLFLSDFSIRLFRNDRERFGTFMNALLSIEDPVMTVTHLEPGHQVHGADIRGRYLEMLFVGTYTPLEYHAFFLGMGMGDRRSQTRFETQMALSSLWASVSIILAEIGSTNGQGLIGLSVSNIELTTNGGVDFYIDYLCPITLERQRRIVSNYALLTGEGLNNAAAARRLEGLRVAQENFASELIWDILTSGSTLAVTTLFPPTVLAIGLADMITSEGRSGSLSGASHFTSSSNIKNGITAGNFGLVETFRAINGWNDLARALEEEERLLFLSWFGSGIGTSFYLLNDVGSSSNTITLFEGLYNSNTIAAMMTWEDSGLVGLGIVNQADVDFILGCDVEGIETNPRFYYLNDQDQQDIIAILNGGFSLIDIFEAERFQRATNHINGILGLELDDGEGSIMSQFHNNHARRRGQE